LLISSFRESGTVILILTAENSVALLTALVYIESAETILVVQVCTVAGGLGSILLAVCPAWYSALMGGASVAIRKSRAACAQSFALWQQATIEITRHDHSIIACSRHIYVVLFFAHIPFVVNHTFNATPAESLQHKESHKCNIYYRSSRVAPGTSKRR